MRILEILIILSILHYLFFSLHDPKNAGRTALIRVTSVNIVLFILHLLLEGLRWQMAPAYIVLLLSALDSLASNSPSLSKKIAMLSKWLFKPLAVIFLFISLLSSAFLPIFHLPRPTGPYKIGTTYLHMIDKNRPEHFTENPDDPRELMVRVWYPAEVSMFSRRMPYLPNGDLALPPILGFAELPAFPLSHLDLVKTHSHLDAPFANAEQRYPVLVFSHGYTNSFEVNQAQLEELASHGYVIFSINHTYEAFGTVFPGGRIVTISKDTFFALNTEPTEYFNDHLATWVADTSFVVDQIEMLDAGTSDDFFANKLDMDHIGVFGMSYGGPTAEEFCLNDERCKAAANMDGSHFGYTDFSFTPLQVPYLVFRNQNWMGEYDDVFSYVQNRAYKVDVNKSEHLHFTDGILWTPLLVWVDQSPIPFSAEDLQFVSKAIQPKEMIKIENAYLLAFFDRHLKLEQVPLLDENIFPFEDVRFYSGTP